jgi:hypothetical protein
MAIKWKVLSTTREENTDIITEALYECKVSTRSGYAKKLGIVKFKAEEDDSDYISFKDLTEKVVLKWIKEELGKDGVKAVEEKVQQEYDKKIAYIKLEQGVPWE